MEVKIAPNGAIFIYGADDRIAHPNAVHWVLSTRNGFAALCLQNRLSCRTGGSHPTRPDKKKRTTPCAFLFMGRVTFSSIHNNKN